MPGVATVATPQGKHLAKNLIFLSEGKAPRAFRYVAKGFMTTIGRNKAIAQVGSLKLGGFIAWLAWRLVPVYFLIGFKNPMAVLLQWIWSYGTYIKGARLITNKNWRTHTSPKPEA
ncbi:MAG: hypothetical protein H7318_05900 [Oligoflexus sp.]|nr:hypothetical protein [Oligoflexus sp.]